jgi:hypothetical protein
MPSALSAIKCHNPIPLALFELSAIAYFPFSQWMSTARVGTQLFLWGQLIYGFLLIASGLATPALLVCLLFQRTRRQSFTVLIFTILFIPCCIAGITLGHRTRTAGMRSFVHRSQPLVAAIKKYEQDHSVPPKTLNDLVPVYIPAVPSTGMMAYPDFKYHTGNNAKKEYEGNPWALSVFTPSGGINFDMMLYFPNQNYPELGYGGRLEHIGDWAYVHE